jgi:hypothetical protein
MIAITIFIIKSSINVPGFEPCPLLPPGGREVPARPGYALIKSCAKSRKARRLPVEARKNHKSTIGTPKPPGFACNRNAQTGKLPNKWALCLIGLHGEGECAFPIGLNLDEVVDVNLGPSFED